MDLLSTNGFSPTLWGPGLWTFMHMLSYNYPLQPTSTHINAYYAFFDSLRHILPCKGCRDEYGKLIRGRQLPLTKSLFVQRQSDPPGTARLRLIRYVHELHTAINRRLGKPTTKPLESWAQHYTRLRKK